MKSEIRIVIADDHPIVRGGLRQAIELQPKLKIIGEAGDGRTALTLLRTLQPEVAILDIDMPELDGFGVARAFQEAGETAPLLIFLTIHREADFLHEALDLGARGYVLKDSATTDIVTAIRAVAAGEHYTSPALSSALLQRRPAVAALAQPALQSLSLTERRILALIAEYKTSKEIADTLGISHRTVETHRTNICQKLTLRGSHALMKFALAHQHEL